MRSTGMKRSGLMLALAVAMLGSEAMAGQAVSLRDAGEGPARRRHQPKRSTELEREIAAHNEAVERRKAEKRSRRLAASPNTGK